VGLFRGHPLVQEEVQDALRNGLKSTVTALLLPCENGAANADLQGGAEIRMRTVYDGKGDPPQTRRSNLTLSLRNHIAFSFELRPLKCKILRTGSSRKSFANLILPALQ